MFSSVVACCVVIFISMNSYYQKKFEELSNAEQMQSDNCEYSFCTLSGYKYIKPLAYVEKNCESEKLSHLKKQISLAIESKKKDASIMSASVYLRDFESSDWTSINDNEAYIPGSLLKVAVMITYLKMEELHPGMLEQQYVVDMVDEKKHDNQNYQIKSVKAGQSYTIRELIKNMIINADNVAANVLYSHLDINVFNKTFEDIGLPKPNINIEKSYTITTKQYSTFYKVLYNAGYLTIANSEYATSLLAQSDFKSGIAKGLSESIPVAHESGELYAAQVHQLHDAGIVYLNNKPYLLVVMTKGKDLNKLSETIGEISKITYQNINKSI
jgi:beta-lactamase class A